MPLCFETWKVLNDLIHKRHSNNGCVNYFQKENSRKSQTEEIVNEFNYYFY